MSGQHATVMFVKAYNAPTRWLAFFEHLAHLADMGYDEIHAELLLDHSAYSAVRSDPEPDAPSRAVHPPQTASPSRSCVVKYSFQRVAPMPMLELVQVPVTSLALAKQIAEEIYASTAASYDIPYAELALPSFLVHDVGSDPSRWHHLYCSQFVLLFLRRCADRGALDLPRERYSLLFEPHCNSVQCTPAHLRRVLRRVLE